VFVVIEVSARPVPGPGGTAHPDRAQTVPRARNLPMDPGEERAAGVRFLVRDRAGQVPGVPGAVRAGAGIAVVTIPPRRPRATAHAGRRVRTARAEVTGRMPIAGPRPPRAVLEEDVAHVGQQRPHRARNVWPPGHGASATAPVADLAAARIRRRKVPGGLTHEYQRAA
jgi:hypothetical protein